MKVWGFLPGERKQPGAKKHLISVASGAYHNPPPRTARGFRRAEKRAEGRTAPVKVAG